MSTFSELRLPVRKVFFALLLSSVTLLASSSLYAQSGTPAKKKAAAQNSTQALMQDKLRSAQNILRGLALEDFQSIKKDADMLKMIATAASWYNAESTDYMRHYKNFEEAVDFLAQHATNKNLEGVAMGYVRLTLTCMQCHNFVRENRTRK